MTDLNIFAPPPDATLDRIVAANRPRIIASLRRHWWQRFTSTKRFTLLSGFTLFAAGALMSAAVLVPQLRPGQPTFSISCFDAENVQVSHLVWGGPNASPNETTREAAQADPASLCTIAVENHLAQRVLSPVATSLVASGHTCGRIQTETGEIYDFVAPDGTDGSLTIFSLEPNSSDEASNCPTFPEPVQIPVVGALAACRAGATSAAVYPIGDESQYTVCDQHGQPIWSGEGR